jgi:hypothetical protein
MKYEGYEVDDFGRAIYCPGCGVETFYHQDEHCRVCNSIIRNRCSDTERNTKEGWNYLLPGCGAVLQGNARYCGSCGNESTFLHHGILDDWKEEMKVKKINCYKELIEIL